MNSTPEQQILELVSAQRFIKESEIAGIFDRLKPVMPEALIGEWNGGSFDTGHPIHAMTKEKRWAGKAFKSLNDVDPIVLFDDKGDRYWLEQYGHAQLREVKYRGVVSAAMIYDNFPMIDSFRYVTGNMVVGAAEDKNTTEDGIYYFYLTRRYDSNNEGLVT